MKSKTFTLIFVGVLLLSFFTNFLVDTGYASGNMIYVDDDNVSGPWNGTEEHPYKKIQDALDASSPGDTIYIYSGNYEKYIEIDTEITLKGSNKHNTILKNITIQANSVTIESVTVRGKIRVDESSSGIREPLNDIKIQNNIVKRETGRESIHVFKGNNISIEGNEINSPYGISIIGGNNVTISDNSLNCEKECIHVSSQNTVISNNYLENMKWGISVQDSNNVEIKENIIKNISYEYGEAISLHSNSDSCIITGNQIQDIPASGHGIKITQSSNNNKIYGNTFTGDKRADYGYDECNNFWYNPETSRGNYWDNYRGQDSNGDGIGDSPYNISGGDNKDLYPLGKFNTPPNKPSQPSPSDGASDVELIGENSVNLEVKVSDPDGDCLNVRFYDASDDTQIWPFNTEPGFFSVKSSETTTSVNWGNLSYNRTYSWYAVASDACLEEDNAIVMYAYSEGLESKSDTFTFTTQAKPPEETPPVADANGVYSGKVDNLIDFNASNSYDEGTITNYTWNFGDGDVGYGVSPVHTYSSAGNYTVVLNVTDNDESTDSDETTAIITEAGNLYHPNAKIKGSYSGKVNESIEFDASDSYDVDGEIISYEWDFGDGTTGVGVAPIHGYSEPGNYTVNLTVKDGDNLTDFDTTIVTISEEKTDGTPGFELLFVLLAMLAFLFWKHKK